MSVGTTKTEETFGPISVGAACVVDGMKTYSASQIAVFEGGTETLCTPGVDYTLTIEPDYSGVTVTPLAPLVARVSAITVARRTSLTSDFDIAPSGRVSEPRLVEQLDRTLMREQENANTFSRALKFPPGETNATLLPASVDRAGKLLGFDNTGAPFAVIADPSGVTKASIGLGDVDNTADAAKPLSAPQADALEAATWVSVSRFGGGPTKSRATNVAAALAAFAALPASGGTLYFGNGNWPMDAFELTGKSALIAGASRNTRLQFPAGSAGIKITLNDGNQTIDLRDLSIETSGANVVGKSALEFIYTITGFGDRWKTRAQLDNVFISGIDPRNSAWEHAIRTQNCNGVTVRGGELCGWQGAAGTAGNAEADNTVSPAAVIYTGAEYPTELLFFGTKFWSYGTAVVGDGNVEGINFTGGSAVNVGRLLDWTSNGRPQCSISGMHINSYWGVVKASAIQQLSTDNANSYYHNPGSTSDYIAFDLTNVIDAKIRGFFLNYETSAGTTTAVRVQGALTANIDIDECHFGGFYAGAAGNPYENAILVTADVPARSVYVGKNNIFKNVYTFYNFGTNDQVMGDPTFTATIAADQSIPSGAWTDVNWTVAVEDGLGVWAGAAAAHAFPKGTHFVDVHVSGMLQASTVGVREFRLLKNGAMINRTYRILNPIGGGGHTPFDFTFPRIPVTAITDTLKFQIQQVSGAALSLFAGPGGNEYVRITYKKVG